MTINKMWVLATLMDLQETLEDALESLQNEPEDAEFNDSVREAMLNLFAKLNFAYNTRYLGEEAFAMMTDDELIGVPLDLPFIDVPDLENLNQIDWETEDAPLDETDDERQDAPQGTH